MNVEFHVDDSAPSQPQTNNPPQKSNPTNKHRIYSNRNSQFQLLTCPFVNFKPAEIEDFSFKDGLPAVARNNCSIDIYNYISWAHIHTIKCDQDTPIKKIVWTKNGQENVLLVAFINCMLSIYSLKDIHPLVTRVATGNAIWDIAVNPSRDEIAIACDNGSTMIYKYEGEDDLYLHKTLRIFQEKALSIAYDGNPQNKNTLYVGYEKGAVRKFDVSSGNVILTINLGPKDLIWKVLSLKHEDTLMVASSAGVISIFETKYGTLRTELKTHEADIICLEANSNHSIVYATGLDSKIVTLEKVSGINSQPGRTGIDSWVVSSSDRGQSHDIKALKLLDENLLISGGVTTDICIYNLDKGRFIERKGKILGGGAQDIKLRHITSLPNTKVMSIATTTNVLLLARDFGIEIWQYNIDEAEYNFLIELRVKTSPILAVAIAHNSKYFAYSTLEETAIFKLSVKNVYIERKGTHKPSSCMIFNHSGTKVFAVRLDGTLCVHDVDRNRVRDLAQLPGEYKGLYNEIDLASTREVIAVGCRIGKTIHVFDYEGLDEQENPVETIPDLGMGEYFTCFKFGANAEHLIIVYESNKFVVYHWKEKILTKWTRENQKSFPQNYLKKWNKIIGIVCNPYDPSQMILYTNYYYIRIHFGSGIPKISSVVRPTDTDNNGTIARGKSRENEENKEGKGEKGENKQRERTGNPNFQLVYRKNPILQLELLRDRKLLCLETSWKDFTAALPGAVNAKKYGL